MDNKENKVVQEKQEVKISKKEKFFLLFKAIMLFIIFVIMVIISLFMVKAQFAMAYSNDEQAIEEAKSYINSLPEEERNAKYKYWFVAKNVNNTEYILVYSENPLIAKISNDNYLLFGVGDRETIKEYYYRQIKEPDNTWYYSVEGGSKNLYLGRLKYTIIASNHDIMTMKEDFTAGSEVFFLPPLGKLSQSVQPQALHPALSQVVAILPVVTILAVGFLALRKGWGLLVKLLQRA